MISNHAMQRNFHVPLFGNSPLFGTVTFKLYFMVYFLNFTKSFSGVFLPIFLKAKVELMLKSNV